MYRTIDAAFWTDPKVRKLSHNGRYLLLYLVTNPHTHVSGLYYLPRSFIQHETGLSIHSLDTLCDTLSSLRLAVFDTPNELVWVVNMFRYQGSGERNMLSAAHHIHKDSHNSFLIEQFIEKYPEVKKALARIGYTIRYQPLATPENVLRITENVERRTDTPVVPLVECGEFGMAKLTHDQYEKLEERMNGSLNGYIERFDLWVHEAPDAKANGVKRKDRHAYESILNWYERDLKEGKIKQPSGKMPAKPKAVY